MSKNKNEHFEMRNPQGRLIATSFSPDPFPVTQQQMNLILMAVEHGWRENERGKNLEGALASVFKLYRVAESAP